MTDSYTTELNVLATSQGVSSVENSQLLALTSYLPPSASYTAATELTTLASTLGTGATVPQTTQLVILAAYRTGQVENFKTRAWTFDLDGHTFYVLHLGNQGTFVYDFTTEQWAQWYTEGYINWNMEQGIVWKGRIIAGDNSNPTIWELDPETELDDGFKPITRIATGGISTRLRRFIPNYSFRLTASLGVPSTTTSTVTLSYSDDQGKTYVDAGSITLDAESYQQELAWLSLGLAGPPGRVFNITDIGGFVRLQGADAELGEE